MTLKTKESGTVRGVYLDDADYADLRLFMSADRRSLSFLVRDAIAMYLRSPARRASAIEELKSRREGAAMLVSPEANAIINEARFNPHVPEGIVRLIEKHGIAAAAEAICLLAQVSPAGPNIPYLSKP